MLGNAGRGGAMLLVRLVAAVLLVQGVMAVVPVPVPVLVVLVVTVILLVLMSVLFIAKLVPFSSDIPSRARNS
jgi:hypothetical protein